MVAELLAFVVVVRGDTDALDGGGGGRGMLGGGGIIRLAGRFTFFILALALGGGTGVDTGVSTFVSFLTSGAFLALAGSAVLVVGVVSAVAAVAVSSAGGTGGGGRRRGFARLSMAVVRLFGLARCLVAEDVSGAVGGATAGKGVFSALGVASCLSLSETGSLLFGVSEVVSASCEVLEGSGEGLGVIFGLEPAAGGGGASLRTALAGADCRLIFGSLVLSLLGGGGCM